MSDQPDQPETDKKPIRVAIVGDVRSTSMLVTLASVLTAAKFDIVEEGTAITSGFDVQLEPDPQWNTLQAFQDRPPAPTQRPSPFRNGKTYADPFSRRVRRRR